MVALWRRLLPLLLALGLVVAACSDDLIDTSQPTGWAGSSTTPTLATSTTSTIPEGDVSAAGTWTVLVYGLGDNNLEAALLEDMREMRKVTRDVSDLTFMVLADRSDEFTSEDLGRLGDWTTTRLIDISEGAFTDLGDWGERNLGDPAVLEEFLDTAVAHAPADHYALVFWDHGSMAAIGPDESHTDVLQLPEIADALAAGLPSAGIGTLDMIGFDACLMAALEVASAVYPHAIYMVASEEVEPNEGWAYAGFGYLATAAEPTVEALGRSLLDAYTETSAAAQPSVTMSLLDLRRFVPFIDALDDLTGEALDNLDSTAVAFGRRRDRVTKFGADPDPARDFFMVDLGQLLRRMGRSETPVAADADRAADLLLEMVVANNTGEAAAGARGLSVHFPSAPEWFYPDWYDTVGSSVWGTFLDGYFNAGRAIAPSRRPAFDPSGDDTTFFFDEFGIEVHAVFDAAAVDTVVSAVMWSGVEEPDGSVTFYSSDQAYVEETTVVGIYDLTRLTLSDGVDTAIAFQQITLNEDLTFFTLTVPLSYRAPIDASAGLFDDPVDVTLILTYDIESEEFTEGLYATNFGTVGPFTAEPTGLLFPKIPRRSPGGEIEWVPTIDVGLWANLPTLTYDFVDLPSGTSLRSELTIADFGGNTATATVSTLTP